MEFAKNPELMKQFEEFKKNFIEKLEEDLGERGAEI